jgi:guanylate kinase
MDRLLFFNRPFTAEIRIVPFIYGGIPGMKDSRIIFVSGPSGAGKGTIVRRFLMKTPGTVLACSYTDRPMRNPEENYYFVNTAAISQMIASGEFLEYTYNAGHYYGTSKEEIRRIEKRGYRPLLEVDTAGFRQLKESPLFASRGTVSLFIVPPSAHALVRRLEGRKSESEATMLARLRTSLKELEALPLYDAVLVNDSIEQTVSRMEAVLEGEEKGDAFDAESFMEELKAIVGEMEAHHVQ